MDPTASCPEAVSFSLTAIPEAEARSLIIRQLDAYNHEHTGVSDTTPLDVLVIDETTNRVVGGLVGRTSLGVLFVEYVFLPESLRGKGNGARLLAIAEQEAIRRGCKNAVLFTMVVQAPSFYERNGYEPFGRVDCNPPNNARVFMRKDLRQRNSLAKPRGSDDQDPRPPSEAF
jgi:GNAT superfamily N-acetyltransferase